jgi:hypothetical protein
MASQPGFPAECPRKDKRTMTADPIQMTIWIRAAKNRARLANNSRSAITRDLPSSSVRNGLMMSSTGRITSNFRKY